MATEILVNHLFTVKNRVVRYHNPELRFASLDAIEAQGGEGFDVARVKSKRISNDTYAYFFGGIVNTALQFNCFAGWDKEVFRKEYEDLFLSEETLVIYRNDEGEETHRRIIKSHRSIADCNQKEMNEFCERVIQDLAEKGIVVLTPEQYYLEKYKSINEVHKK